DVKTGGLSINTEKSPKVGLVVREICPAAPGAKDWQPSAYSPKSGLYYIPHQNLCMDEEGLEANYIAGTPYVGMNVKIYPGPDGHQYVAVLAGVGGWSGAIVAGGLDGRDSSAALGFVNAMRDLPEKTTRGGMLYVFAL